MLGPAPGVNYGLGNQMFQIAAITTFAQDNGLQAVFPQLLEPKYGNYIDNILHNVSTQQYNFTNNIETPKFCSTNSSKWYQIPVHKNAIYNGYFQSEKFFSHNYEGIIRLFRLRESQLSDIKTEYEWLNQYRRVSLHVRRGDYLVLTEYHRALDISYYRAALDYLKGEYDKCIVCSDDIEWCKENFVGDEFIFIEDCPDYVDLYLMQQCQHNIIANSTFSWWSAWLNSNPDKIVITTKNDWFHPDSTGDDTELIPTDWIRI